MQLQPVSHLESYNLYDINGRLLHHEFEINSQPTTIHLKNYQAGIYFLSAKLLDENILVTQRLVKH